MEGGGGGRGVRGEVPGGMVVGGVAGLLGGVGEGRGVRGGGGGVGLISTCLSIFTPQTELTNFARSFSSE